MTATTYRNLAFSTLHDAYMPVEITHWATHELDEYKCWLMGQGRWNPRVEARWDALMQHRSAELEKRFCYPSYPLPPLEVMPEATLGQLASRALWCSPQVPLVAHALAESLKDATNKTTKGSIAAGKRVLAVLHRFGSDRNDCLVLHGGLALAGGLSVLVLGDRLRLTLDNKPLAELPATDAMLPLLRRMAVRWFSYVRQSIAYALRLCVATYNLSTQSPIELGIPLRELRSGQGVVASLAGGKVREVTAAILPQSPASIEHDLRYALARTLMQVRYHPHIEAQALEAALRESAVHAPPFRSLIPPLPTHADALSRADDTSHRMIRAFRGAEITGLDDPAADRFDVYQDDVAIPRLIGSFAMLALAVDFERSNRKTVGMRLSLGIAGNQISYQCPAIA